MTNNNGKIMQMCNDCGKMMKPLKPNGKCFECYKKAKKPTLKDGGE